MPTLGIYVIFYEVCYTEFAIGVLRVIIKEQGGGNNE